MPYHLHVAVTLSAIIKRDQLCIGFVRELDPEVREASTEAIQAQAVIKQAMGLKVWPSAECTNRAPCGRCMGHRE